ncbi:MAG: protein-export chaperone SecB [Rickettsiales bacterium]|nr:protein-export chaperone SecB [Rickettsiales bacterium]
MNENQTTDDKQPLFALRSQYVKDLSLENPHAPASLMAAGQQAPKVELSIDLAAQKIQDGLFELMMRINVRALGERTLFMVDLTYAGLFGTENIPEADLEPIIMVDGAFILFPFARRVVADVTRDGGFPPLLLEPVDFYRFYQEKRAQAEVASA